MVERISEAPKSEGTEDVLRECFEKFTEEHPEHGECLDHQLRDYASVAKDSPRESALESLTKIFASQIESRVANINRAGNNVSTHEFIKALFIPNKNGRISADIIMKRFFWLRLG